MTGLLANERSWIGAFTVTQKQGTTRHNQNPNSDRNNFFFSKFDPKWFKLLKKKLN